MRVTVNTSTVKTIVPKVQLPNTCKTHGTATEPRPPGEAQHGDRDKQGAGEGRDRATEPRDRDRTLAAPAPP